MGGINSFVGGFTPYGVFPGPCCLVGVTVVGVAVGVVVRKSHISPEWEQGGGLIVTDYLLPCTTLLEMYLS